MEDDEDFYVETMSVELAFRRELEYREMLASQLGTDHHLLTNLVPLPEVQSSIAKAVSNRPSDSITTYNSMLSTKRKEAPTRSVVEEPSFKENKIIATVSEHDNLRCKLCEVDCSGRYNLAQHLRGHKHRSKLQEVSKGNRKWYCVACSVPCTNEDTFKAHLDGKKHKAKILEPSSSSGQRLYCDVCQIWCIDEPSFRQHLDGKKHKSQFRGNLITYK